MLLDFISITELQRNIKHVFSSKEKPFQMVLSNNSLTGIVINKEAAEMLLKSGVLDQIREELWELNDPETREVVESANRGDDSDSISLDNFIEEYGI